MLFVYEILMNWIDLQITHFPVRLASFHGGKKKADCYGNFPSTLCFLGGKMEVTSVA